MTLLLRGTILAFTILPAASLTGTAWQPNSPQSPGLKIVVIAGEDAINVIQQKTAVAPIVEVRDRNEQPVAGAVVNFAIRGGRATFGGARTLTVATDIAGRAVATGLTPTASGALQIGASAAFQGQTAAITISQTNVLTAAQAAAISGADGAGGGGAATGAGAAGSGGGGLSGLTIAGIAGGAGVGALVAARASGGSDPAGPTSSGPPPTNPALFAAAGTYTLVQINGSSLPAVTVASPPNPCPGFTDSGTLTLTTNPEVYDLSERSHIECGTGPGNQFNSRNSGTWSLQGGTITFTPGGTGQFSVGPGTLSGSTLTFPFDAPHANAGNPPLRVNSTWTK